MNRFLPIAALALLACPAARAHPDEISNSSLKGTANPPAAQAAPEFHAAGAIAALTLLLCGVAVLKGSRRE